ncbi:MAG: Crp/Fnr family transcriptional regulator [Candidatus Levyibacteriota bacterium]
MSNTGLPEKQFADLFIRIGKERHYKKNEIVMRPDDPPSGIYCIKKGHIRTYSITESGSERIHIIYKADDIFPLTWALIDQQKELFYQTMDDTILLRAQKKDFLDFILSNHTATLILLKKMAAMFSMFSDRINDLEISKTYPRVVSTLLFFAKQYGEPLTGSSKSSDSCIISTPITHQDIANFSTVTRETTSREISSLLKSQIISYKDHLIVVNSIKNLKKELLKNTTVS